MATLKWLPAKDFLPPEGKRSKFAFDPIEPIQPEPTPLSFRRNLKVIEGGKGLPKRLDIKDQGIVKPICISIILHVAIVCFVWWIGQKFMQPQNTAAALASTSNQVFMVSIVGSVQETFPQQEKPLVEEQPKDTIQKDKILVEESKAAGRMEVQAKPKTKTERKVSEPQKPQQEAPATAVDGPKSPAATGPMGTSTEQIGGAGGNAALTYQQLVAAHIAKNKRYPKRARERSIEGRVVVSLTLSRAGALEQIQVVDSDSPLLSEGVETMLQHAAPFPPIPESISGTSVNFQVPIRFNLIAQ
jgi:protein TonB